MLRQATDPVPLADAAAVLDRSDERDVELQRILTAWREGFLRGLEVGMQEGRRQAAEEESAQRREAAGLVAKATAGPSHTELELRRWGPGGREHFGDPRPGDFAGQGDRPQPRPAGVWLGGPPVHYHECTAVCRSYAPGWYTLPDNPGTDGAA
jgi:hypothetical protein